jgi:hypothetical protein
MTWDKCPICGRWFELRDCEGYPEELEKKLLKRKFDEDQIPMNWRYRSAFAPDY